MKLFRKIISLNLLKLNMYTSNNHAHTNNCAIGYFFDKSGTQGKSVLILKTATIIGKFTNVRIGWHVVEYKASNLDVYAVT